MSRRSVEHKTQEFIETLAFAHHIPILHDLGEHRDYVEWDGVEYVGPAFGKCRRPQ